MVGRKLFGRLRMSLRDDVIPERYKRPGGYMVGATFMPRGAYRSVRDGFGSLFSLRLSARSSVCVSVGYGV